MRSGPARGGWPTPTAHRLRAGARAGAGGAAGAHRRRCLRVLTDPHRPDRPPLDAGHAMAATGRALRGPLRADRADGPRAARGPLLRALRPRLWLPRGFRP